MKKNSVQYCLSVIFSLVAVAINYLITFFLTSFITDALGAEAYGFVSLAKTFASYASIVTVAINSFAARYISIEYHLGNYERANKFFNSVLFVDLLLTIALLLAFGISILFLEKILAIPSELVWDVKVLFLLDMINFLILTNSTVFLVSTTIKNRLDISNIFKIIAYIFEGVFLFVVYSLLPPSLYYIGLSLIISSLIIFIANFIFTKKATPELRINLKDVSKRELKEVFKPGIWNSINSLGNTLNTGLDLLVSNAFLTLLETGLLAIVKTVSTIFSTLYQLIAQPFQPLQLKYYANNEKEKLLNSFKLAMKIDGLFANVFFAGFAAFGLVFFRLWVPKADYEILYALSMITLIGSLTEGATYPLFYSYTLTAKNRIPCFVTIISGVLNVASMLIFIKLFNCGVYVVVTTTSVISILGNFVFTPIYSAHCLNVSKKTFYPQIIRHVISSCVLGGIFILLSQVIKPYSWITLIATAALFFVFGASIHCLITFSKTDWLLLLNIFRRKSYEQGH